MSLDLHIDPPDAVVAAAGRLDPISLAELGAAELMDRTDRKFMIPINALPGLLEEIGASYRALEVEGRRLSRYATRYFDTPDLAMYHAHHAGRLRRYKVRVRSYLDSQAAFLEVKFKTQQGRTLKQRIGIDSEAMSPMEQLAQSDLLGVAQSFSPGQLDEVMTVTYSRLTLVRRDSPERITLDLALTFSSAGQVRRFPGVVVAEIKQGKRTASPFLDALREMNLREGSLSKYCAGIASLDPRVKSNRFRPALRRLETLGESAAA